MEEPNSRLLPVRHDNTIILKTFIYEMAKEAAKPVLHEGNVRSRLPNCRPQVTAFYKVGGD